MSTEEIRAIELLGSVSYGRLATSMRAMPFVAPARHVVADGRVLIRLHRGLGYHRACNGSVVAYGADNLHSGAARLWAVQFTGTAGITEPTSEERAAFGSQPSHVDGETFEPVYMRIEPQFVTLHTLDHPADRPADHPADHPAENSAPSGERPIHHAA
ncbi:pyridoxamine 5'-phosphate oxidase family protein [Streptomyces sp. NPDC004787]|uniref:pyridoxamine 5'-phosphate oxidase family protein n=1 Tax=Streptomyces sp. NPDC004787 TaxID=3154291 RepID=UPI0033B2DCFC